MAIWWQRTILTEAKFFYEENNTVFHAIFPEQNFQQLPVILDAVACEFSTSKKLVYVYSDCRLYI